MALSTGSSATSADITALYTQANALISNYSNGLSSLSATTAVGNAINASDVNTLVTGLASMKADKYLGSTEVSSYYSTYNSVSAGAKITPPTSISTTLSNLTSAIKCKNTASNSYGTYTNSHGTYTNSHGTGTHGNGTYTQGHGWTYYYNYLGHYANGGACSNGTGTYSHGTYTQSNVTGKYSHTTSRNTHGTTVNVTNSNSTITK